MEIEHLLECLKSIFKCSQPIMYIHNFVYEFGKTFTISIYLLVFTSISSHLQVTDILFMIFSKAKP